jgi:D-proline reductase (dithiol) PrdB
VGLIQYAIEKAGIPTISISHLAEVTKKVRVPRSLHLRFPLGRSFGRAGDDHLQTQILQDAIHYLSEMNSSETMVKLPYKWKGKGKK